MLKMLDLFSGIGGFSLAASWTGEIETVAFCEIKKYPQAILRKNFPGVPIYDDVRELTAERLRADGIDRVDIVTGGDPCQPHSLAGKRKGTGDDRFLWPAMLRVVQECGPTWIVNENVIGSESNMVLDQKITDLENAGYECQPFDIPACAAGARHERRRLILVAYSNRHSVQRGAAGGEERCKKSRDEQLAGLLFFGAQSSASLSRTYRANDGIPNRIHRIKALGNSIVPQVAYPILQAIVDIEGAK